MYTEVFNMLPITIPAPKVEEWDEQKEEFIYRDVGKSYKLNLEHSLVAIAKWESKWHKPFIGTDKTDDEFIDYVKDMTITPNIPDAAYTQLSQENLADIADYISNPMTATTFPKTSNKKNKEIITAELIYYWMLELGIPVEFQKWHINRLITLIRVCEVQRAPGKKKSQQELIRDYAALNEARRKKYNTKG